MMPFDPKHVCTSCVVPHIDNCPECFGWGHREDTGAPIPADDACGLAVNVPASVRCMMCGSDATGEDGRQAAAPRGTLYASKRKA